MRFLLAGLLLGLPLLAPAQTSSPTTPHFYVGLGATALTQQPFHSYGPLLVGPALTVGYQFTPRMAVQLSGAYNWQDRAYSDGYIDPAYGATVESVNTTDKLFTLPLLLRATLTKPGSRWQVDALGGAQVRFYSSTYRYSVVSPGRYELSQDERTGTTAHLLLGPGVRYAVKPQLELTLNALINYNLQRGYYGFSTRLSSTVAAGFQFNFGR